MLEHDAAGLTLHDSWGEPVVRWTSPPPSERVLAWVGRLSELHRWLAMAQEPSPMLEGAFELRWGVRRDDGTLDRMDQQEDVELPDGVAVGVELHILGNEPRLYLSVFRITSDRAVVCLTEHGTGGLPCTKDRPARLGIGRGRDPVVLSRAPGSGALDELPSEALVSVVTVRPLPLHGIEREAIDRDAGHPNAPPSAMVVARYRLRSSTP